MGASGFAAALLAESQDGRRHDEQMTPLVVAGGTASTFCDADGNHSSTHMYAATAVDSVIVYAMAVDCISTGLQRTRSH